MWKDVFDRTYHSSSELELDISEHLKRILPLFHR